MAEIYNNSWSEDARDKLVARLTTLMSTMASGYNPTFSYIYECHNVANLQLNAVTVDLDSALAGPVGANQYAARWTMQFSIRVHTAYADGIVDGQKQARLLNSIAEGLKEDMDLADGHRIQALTELVTREGFEESDSIGGHLICVTTYDAQYTQP
jgi:hypothetical protein